MRKEFALAIVLSGLLACVVRAHDGEAILGDWQCVAMQLGHKETTDQDVKTTTISITASKIAFRFGSDCDGCQLEWKVRPDTSPKQLDMFIEEDGEVQHVKGIYRLDGDALEICVGDGDGERPTEFKIDKDKHFQWLRLERVK